MKPNYHVVLTKTKVVPLFFFSNIITFWLIFENINFEKKSKGTLPWF